MVARELALPLINPPLSWRALKLHLSLAGFYFHSVTLSYMPPASAT